MVPTDDVAIVDAWGEPEARRFFENVWPMYVHELSGFGSVFYHLDSSGRWLPDIAGDWVSSVTPADNLDPAVEHGDLRQPFQRAHVIARAGFHVGFACIGLRPFKYMPEDADVTLAEFFLTRAVRGTGTGRRALELLLARYPGRWYLRALEHNARAIRFWRKTLPAVGTLALEEGLESGDVTWRFSRR
jgi:predicted acetyltransferase